MAKWVRVNGSIKQRVTGSFPDDNIHDKQRARTAACWAVMVELCCTGETRNPFCSSFYEENKPHCLILFIIMTHERKRIKC